METQEIKRSNSSIEDIVAKTMTVAYENVLTVLGIAFAMGTLSYWSDLVMAANENPIPRVLAAITASILTNGLMIVLLLTIYKTIKGHSFDQPIPTIKRSLIPYIVTMWIIKIIVGFLMGITGIVVSGLTLAFKNPMITIGLTSMAIVPIALYFYIRYAFALQLVVLEKKYYAEALNISEKMSVGCKKTIMVIQIIPVLVSVIVNLLIKEFHLSLPIESFVSSGLSVLASVYSAIAITVLYLVIKE